MIIYQLQREVRGNWLTFWHSEDYEASVKEATKVLKRDRVVRLVKVTSEVTHTYTLESEKEQT